MSNLMKVDGATLSRPAVWLDALELTKPRITLMVVITTAVGLLVAVPSSSVASLPMVVLAALGGTMLLSAGSSALNMWIERELDARMARTRQRPLPSGRIAAETALLIGCASSVLGALLLLLWTNGLTAALGVATLAGYLFAYTPLKLRTAWATVVGAVPGAIPPAMGWTALQGRVDAVAWALFAILFLWQLPHFYAIDWLYREDYRAAGFRTLAASDPDGRRIALASVLSTLALFAAALTPVALGLAGLLYGAGAALLSVGFLWRVLSFARARNRGTARRVMLYSVVYLPLVLGLLVVDVLV